MGVHDGHRARKKDRYRRYGLLGMADHEVLELLLFYAIPRRDTNELAHRLLDEFGTLDNVLNAPIEALSRVEGMGENSALLIRLVHDVHTYVPDQPKRKPILNSTQACTNYAMKRLLDAREEILYEFCLDGKGKLLQEYVLSKGSRESAIVNIRKAVSYALNCECSRVVLAHNHPSGVALASQADRITTLHLRDALKGVNIQLVDHIVVADGDCISMASCGDFLQEKIYV